MDSKIELADRWETICMNPHTCRLSVPNGWLYKVGDQIAFVPDSTDDELYRIADALEVLKDLFEESTFEFGSRDGVRAIRISNTD